MDLFFTHCYGILGQPPICLGHRLPLRSAQASPQSMQHQSKAGNSDCICVITAEELSMPTGNQKFVEEKKGSNRHPSGKTNKNWYRLEIYSLFSRKKQSLFRNVVMIKSLVIRSYPARYILSSKGWVSGVESHSVDGPSESVVNLCTKSLTCESAIPTSSMKDFPLIPYISHEVIVHAIWGWRFPTLCKNPADVVARKYEGKTCKNKSEKFRRNQMKTTPQHNTMKHKGQLPGLCCPQ